MPQPKLKIAIQKSGRLSEDSLALFKESGIKFSNGQRKLRTLASNFPVEFLFLRNSDIPGYVADGIADFGHHWSQYILGRKKGNYINKSIGIFKMSDVIGGT